MTNLRQWSDLFLAEFKRGWIQFIRYPAEAIGGVFIITAVFYGLFLSAQYIAGPGLNFGSRLDSIIVGYILWTLVTFVFFDISGNIQNESQTGTLEQLFISPFSAPLVFLTRAIADLFSQALLLIVILLLLMTLTGRWLSFPPILVLPLLTVLMGAYGLSFMMGSLALLFKRIQQLIAIVQFTLLFLLTAPMEEWTGLGKAIGYCLPMGIGAGLLRNLMARQQGLDWQLLGLAVVNGAVYLAIGLSLFCWAERSTKRRGTLGGY